MHEERVVDDIMERLRLAADTSHLPSRDDWCVGVLPSFLEDAADEIEQLREKRDRWQATAAGLSQDISNAEDEIELLREALSRWEAVVNSVTQGHNKLGLNGYDIVDAELRVLRHGRELDADEIERLRAERDRWRKIADDFAEAGSNRVAHSEVVDDHEEARRD